MKKFQTLSILLITFLAVNVALAQNNLKAPVRYKLKNGVTLIVAQNVGSGKIYSRLTVENQADDSSNIFAQLLENYMSNKAKAFNETNPSQVTLNYNEANTATTVANFEQALNLVAESFINPEITKTLFSEMKELYTGKKADLDALTFKDFQAYYSKNFKAADTFITIAGDISPVQAKELVNKSLGNSKDLNLITAAK
ncbi:MAG: insulinase family protein [Pedobacter sp.]|nr:MAG: insulinase family protein [Pedobacter sp.]